MVWEYLFASLEGVKHVPMEMRNKVSSMLCVFTNVESWLGIFSVGEWLRAAAFIKRRAVAVMISWDKIDGASFTIMMKGVIARVHLEDLFWGEWCIDGPKLIEWLDVSSLPTEVLLVYNRTVVEDASWFKKREGCTKCKFGRAWHHIRRYQYDIDVGKQQCCTSLLTLHVHTKGLDISAGKTRIYT